MSVESGKEITVDLSLWNASVENVCGSDFTPPRQMEDLRLASTCVQITFSPGTIQLLTCDGRDFRSFRINQPIPDNMHTSVVVDKSKLKLVSEIFEGVLINVSLSRQELNFKGLSENGSLSLPIVSERLAKVGHHRDVDLKTMYDGYNKPECDIMFGIDSLKRIITMFDYRRKVNDRTVVLSTPRNGILKLSQGTGSNRKEANIGFTGNGLLPVPIHIDQSTLKNFIRTVNFPTLPNRF